MKEKITSLKDLKEKASKDGGVDCFILLNGGLRSSKQICWNGKYFSILNYIDDSEEELTEKEIMNDKITLIGKALKNNVLFIN